MNRKGRVGGCLARFMLISIAAASMAGCAFCRCPATTAGDGAPPAMYLAAQQVGEYISTGRYNREVERVVAAARAWMEERAPRAQMPAIVLDVDETAISNLPAFRINGWCRIDAGGCNLERGPCGLEGWHRLAAAPAIEPTLSLARRAQELGVEVFFITSRPARMREITEKNLREQGFRWKGLYMPDDGTPLRRLADFKVPVRRQLAEAGYSILFSLGDQYGDLEGGFAERTFKLPNPIYQLP